VVVTLLIAVAADGISYMSSAVLAYVAKKMLPAPSETIAVGAAAGD
jgi:hypothetical protein